MITELGTLFQQGGLWMYPILAVQIVSIALIAERFAALYMKRSVNARDIVQSFECISKAVKWTSSVKPTVPVTTLWPLWRMWVFSRPSISAVAKNYN